MGRVGRVLHKGEQRAACKVLVRKLEGRRPSGRSALRSDYSIAMSLKNMIKGADWIKLAQDRDKLFDLVNTVMKIRFARYLWSFLTG
jgi:hypothetical protein